MDGFDGTPDIHVAEARAGGVESVYLGWKGNLCLSAGYEGGNTAKVYVGVAVCVFNALPKDVIEDVDCRCAGSFVEFSCQNLCRALCEAYIDFTSSAHSW